MLFKRTAKIFLAQAKIAETFFLYMINLIHWRGRKCKRAKMYETWTKKNYFRQIFLFFQLPPVKKERKSEKNFFFVALTGIKGRRIKKNKNIITLMFHKRFLLIPLWLLLNLIFRLHEKNHKTERTMKDLKIAVHVNNILWIV